MKMTRLISQFLQAFLKNHFQHKLLSNHAVNLSFICRHFWVFLNLILRVWRGELSQHCRAILEEVAARTEDDHMCMTNIFCLPPS